MSFVKSAAKRIINGPAPKIKEKVLFLHVPKCGGTSVDKAIKAGFGGFFGLGGYRVCQHVDAWASEAAGAKLGLSITNAREVILTYLAEFEETRYISGHFRFTPVVHKLHAEGWKIITVLRDPVEKWKSQYFYNSKKKSDHFRIKESLGDFIETERSRNYGCDLINNFAPHIPLDKQGEQSAVDEAIEVLKTKCCVVGFTDRMDDFAAKINDEFGFKPRFKVHNVNPASRSDKDKMLTPDIAERIEQICQPNKAVYDSLRYFMS